MTISIPITIGWTGPGAISWDSWLSVAENATGDEIEKAMRAEEVRLDADYPDESPHFVERA